MLHKLRRYFKNCCQEIVHLVQINLGCPNCGRQVVSARKRIIYGSFLHGTCPYCETKYRSNLILSVISALLGMPLYLKFNQIIEAISFVPEILFKIVSLFIVLPLCLFVPSCIVAPIGIFIFPLIEEKQNKGDT